MKTLSEKVTGLHKHLVQSVIEALDFVFLQGNKADRVVDRFLKSQKKWGSRDRRFFAETVYDVVRSARWLAAGVGISDNWRTWTRAELWKIWGARVLSRGEELPSDWPEVTDLIWQKPVETGSRAIRFSISDELDQIGQEQWGDQWESLLSALNTPAEVYLRVNSLSITPEKLQERLIQEGVQTEIFDPLKASLRLVDRKNLAKSASFNAGLFEIQDLASQEVGLRVNPQPGETVIDACAGGGGKSLHLATLMGNQGKLIALDVSSTKLKALRERALRNKIKIIETRALDTNIEEAGTSGIISQLHEKGDRVLLDVPCSGSGVLRRNPDAKWRINQEILDEVQRLQKQILDTYSLMVKEGGRLVYSTCSVFPSENQKQIEQFLQGQEQVWRLVSEEFCDPRERAWDGFYVAVLERLKRKA